MRLFHDRPLASAAAAFVAVSVAARYMSGEMKLLLGAAVLMLAVFALAASSVKRWEIFAPLRKMRGAIAAVSLFALGAVAVSYVFFDVWCASWSARGGERAFVNGYVTDVEYENGYSGSYRVTLTSVDGRQTRAGAILEADFAVGFELGDEFSANVEFESLAGDEWGSYYIAHGVLVRASVSGADALSYADEHEGIDIAVGRLRERISSVLASVSGNDGGGIPEALFVGDREKLDDVIYRDFTYIGALHLLAVSGLHLSVLIGGLDRLLRRFMRKTPRCALLMCFTVAYMLLTGLSPSVTRAGLMMVIYYLENFARREADSVTSLFSAAALIMLVSPGSAGDVGLLLSVTAMLGCLFADKLFFTDGMKKAVHEFAEHGVLCKCISRAASWLYVSVMISVSAMLFTLPVSWLSFGRISLLSPLSALLLSLPVKLILYLCPLLLLLSWSPALVSAPALLCGAICKFTAGTAGAISQIRGAGIMLSGESIAATIACAAVAVCLFSSLVMKRRGAICAFCAAGAIFTVTAAVSVILPAHADGVFYMNRGKNDVFLVRDGGEVLICDITDGTWSPTNDAVSSADCDRIGAYMLTHLHRRHINTIERLCSRRYVDRLLLPSPETEAEYGIFDSICDVAEKYGVTVLEYDRGTELSFGKTQIETLSTSFIKRSTHPTIALGFERDGERTVYIGASVHESEIFESARLMCRDADEVIFGIHGPVYKSGADFGLDAGARVIYASAYVADYLLDHNKTDSFSVYGDLP